MRLIAKILLIIAVFATMGVFESNPLSLPWPAAVLAVLVVTFVATLIHELAHAGAAHWFGADISKIVVLPFEFNTDGHRLRLVGRAGKGDLGGYVTYKLDRIAPRRKHAIIAALGPAANLVTGFMAGWIAQGLAVKMTPSLGETGNPIAPVLMAFAIVSVGMGLANLIPFDRSDGMRIWRYFRPISS